MENDREVSSIDTVLWNRAINLLINAFDKANEKISRSDMLKKSLRLLLAGLSLVLPSLVEMKFHVMAAYVLATFTKNGVQLALEHLKKALMIKERTNFDSDYEIIHYSLVAYSLAARLTGKSKYIREGSRTALKGGINWSIHFLFLAVIFDCPEQVVGPDQGVLYEAIKTLLLAPSNLNAIDESIEEPLLTVLKLQKLNNQIQNGNVIQEALELFKQIGASLHLQLCPDTGAQVPPHIQHDFSSSSIIKKSNNSCSKYASLVVKNNYGDENVDSVTNVAMNQTVVCHDDGDVTMNKVFQGNSSKFSEKKFFEENLSENLANYSFSVSEQGLISLPGYLLININHVQRLYENALVHLAIRGGILNSPSKGLMIISTEDSRYRLDLIRILELRNSPNPRSAYNQLEKMATDLSYNPSLSNIIILLKAINHFRISGSPVHKTKALLLEVLKNTAKEESKNAEIRSIVCLLMASIYMRTDFGFARKMVSSAFQTIDLCSPYLDIFRPLVTLFLDETDRRLSLPS